MAASLWNIIKECLTPTLHLTLWVTKELGPEDEEALQRLADAGFRPHLTVLLTAQTVHRAADGIVRLASRLGDSGFTLGFQFPEARSFRSSFTFGEALPDPASVEQLLRALFSCRNLCLDQFWLLSGLYQRVRDPGYLLPCLAEAGRGIFITTDGLCASCHRRHRADPLSVREDPVAIIDQASTRRPDRYWSGNPRCADCDLRYACGGICQYATRRFGSQDLAESVHELHCVGRRMAFKIMLDDATAEQAAPLTSRPRWRLRTRKGQVSLCEVQSTPCLPA